MWGRQASSGWSGQGYHGGGAYGQNRDTGSSVPRIWPQRPEEQQQPQSQRWRQKVEQPWHGEPPGGENVASTASAPHQAPAVTWQQKLEQPWHGDPAESAPPPPPAQQMAPAVTWQQKLEQPWHGDHAEAPSQSSQPLTGMWSQKTEQPYSGDHRESSVASAQVRSNVTWQQKFEQPAEDVMRNAQQSACAQQVELPAHLQLRSQHLQQQQAQLAQQQAWIPPSGPTLAPSTFASATDLPPGGNARPPDPLQLIVSGCEHVTIGVIVRGTFILDGRNHDRPTYKKTTQVDSLDVMLYYWDARDGERFAGWWIGPKVGGDQVWTHHPGAHEEFPPTSGWRILMNGPVDHSITVTPQWHKDLQGVDPALARQLEQPAVVSTQPYPATAAVPMIPAPPPPAAPCPTVTSTCCSSTAAADQGAGPVELSLQDRAEMLQRRKEELDKKCREREEANRLERQKLEEKRKEREDMLRAVANVKKAIMKVKVSSAATFEQAESALITTMSTDLDLCGSSQQALEEECGKVLDAAREKVAKEEEFARIRQDELDAKKQKESEQRRQATEDRQRRMAEARRQLEEEERAKAEAANKEAEERRAIQDIRSSLQKLREAREPEFDGAKQELEAALEAELHKCGSHQEMLHSECQQEIKQVTARITKIREQLQRRKEQKDALGRLLAELEDHVVRAENAVMQLKESVTFLSDSNLTAADVEDIIQVIQEGVTESGLRTQSCKNYLAEHDADLRDHNSLLLSESSEISVKVNELRQRLTRTIKYLTNLTAASHEGKLQAFRYAMANEQEQQLNDCVMKYSSCQDALSRVEVAEYAKTEFGFDVPEETLDHIFASLVTEGSSSVTKDELHLVRAAIGIALECARS